MSTTTASRETDSFLDWLESPFVRVAGSRKHGQWYAVAEDYDIAGMGPTEEAAYRDVSALVEAYLRSCHRQGLRYRDSWRRVSRTKKLLYVPSARRWPGPCVIEHPRPWPRKAVSSYR